MDIIFMAQRVALFFVSMLIGIGICALIILLNNYFIIERDLDKVNVILVILFLLVSIISTIYMIHEVIW